MNIENALAYLDQLPSIRVRRDTLDTAHAVDTPTPDANANANANANAGIIKSQLIAFTSNLDSQFKEAVKYSTLLAQFVADKKFDHVNQRMEWYGAYNEALKNAGWIGSNNKITRYKNSNLELSMENVAIELVKLAAGPNAALIAELTSTTINALKNDGETLSKLQASSNSGSSGAFHILPTMQSGDDVVMYNHAMIYEHSNASGGLWFWSWTLNQASLSHAANEWTLNYAHYKNIESRLKEILGESTNKFFDSLDL
ncbi:hypothetical protein P0Y43_21405 [Pseudomonas entomophila]|uniref:hypothetical protein n=1 Tax=Pseudomonas entomophila TaxID=312306 RepID=UPI0023D82455|nr:hypothetical protein [Pseudomonas entomophila]MDF0733256.1 hypothetical protein [Pseudomonas entomophila]